VLSPGEPEVWAAVVVPEVEGDWDLETAAKDQAVERGLDWEGRELD